MNKTIETPHIALARLELAKFQKNAKHFASQYRQYRARKSNLAQPYKIMATLALSRVRDLKRYIRNAVSTQQKIDELNIQIANLES